MDDISKFFKDQIDSLVNLHDELSRVLEGASDDLRDLYERFIEWIRARDPVRRLARSYVHLVTR